jgi:hypothetical protein
VAAQGGKRSRGGLLDTLQDQEESQASGEQWLAADGTTWRSGVGGATWLGEENACGVGRAVGGRAGCQVVQVGRQGGSWWLGRSPARGWRAAKQ